MGKLDFEKLKMKEVPSYSEASSIAMYDGGYPNVEVVRVEWKPGNKAHPHSHPEEVYWYVVNGRVAVTLGDDEFEVKTGEGWHTPSNLVHSEVFLEETTGIVFKYGPGIFGNKN